MGTDILWQAAAKINGIWSPRQSERSVRIFCDAVDTPGVCDPILVGPGFPGDDGSGEGFAGGEKLRQGYAILRDEAGDFLFDRRLQFLRGRRLLRCRPGQDLPALHGFTDGIGEEGPGRRHLGGTVGHLDPFFLLLVPEVAGNGEVPRQRLNGLERDVLLLEVAGKRRGFRRGAGGGGCGGLAG